MALTDYVTLGQSGLKVSPFCFGAMTFGNEWGFGSDEPTSKRILDEFLERGGNFIDTSNFYTQGHSERIIGEHIDRGHSAISFVRSSHSRSLLMS